MASEPDNTHHHHQSQSPRVRFSNSVTVVPDTAEERCTSQSIESPALSPKEKILDQYDNDDDGGDDEDDNEAGPSDTTLSLSRDAFPDQYDDDDRPGVYVPPPLDPNYDTASFASDETIRGDGPIQGFDAASSPILRRRPRPRQSPPIDFQTYLERRHDARSTQSCGVQLWARERKWSPAQGEDVWTIYEAALRDEWVTAEKIFLNDRMRSKEPISSMLETPLHVAVGTGISNRFVRELLAFLVGDDEAVAMTDCYGDNALHYAARVGNMEAVVMLAARTTAGLMYVMNNNKRLPVQIAAIHCQKVILTYLIRKAEAEAEPNVKNSPFSGDLGIRLLMAATASGFFDVALYLVEKYEGLAKSSSGDDAGGSALSTIAQMASAFTDDGESSSTWWHNLIPSCISRLESSTWRSEWTADDIENRQMEAANHTNSSFLETKCALVSNYFGALINKAVQRLEAQVKSIDHKKPMHQQAFELVKSLCQKVKSLPYDEASAIYEKSILLAARHGNHDAVRVIIETFPTSVFAKDPKSGENIFALAVRERHENVFNIIYDMSDRKYNFYNSMDNGNNNYMHSCALIAPPHKLNLVPGPALQMQRELQWFEEVKNFVHLSRREWQNNAHCTAKMLFSEQHGKLKAEGEAWMRSTATSCSVAAALIATIMFAAAFTVPGGVSSESGIPLFRNDPSFLLFIVSDAVALFTSLTSLLVFLSILTSRYAEEDFLYVLPRRSIVGLLALFVSVMFMMVAFGATLYLMLVEKYALLLIPVAFLACLPVASFVLLQFPLLCDVVSSTYGPGIFGKKTGKLLY